MEIVSLLGEAMRRLKNAIEFENGRFSGVFLEFFMEDSRLRPNPKGSVKEHIRTRRR